MFLRLSFWLKGKLTFTVDSSRDFKRGFNEIRMPGVPVQMLPRGTTSVTIFKTKQLGALELILVDGRGGWIEYVQYDGMELYHVVFCKKNFSKVYGSTVPPVLYYTYK